MLLLKINLVKFNNKKKIRKGEIQVAKKLRYNLRLVMAKKGVRTVAEISEATGITKATLSGIDNNTTRRVYFDTLEKICEYLDCDIGELLVLE
jgi:putative transcriptional regulator